MNTDKTVIGLAEYRVCNRPVTYVTYALGTCIGVTIYDPIAKVGGMLHVMLPDSATNREKARARPGMFVDTGIPRLFRAAYKLGAKKSRLIVRAAGGNDVRGSKPFHIGAANVAALRKIFWKNGVLLESHSFGGSVPRTLTMSLTSGSVLMRTEGRNQRAQRAL